MLEALLAAAPEPAPPPPLPAGPVASNFTRVAYEAAVG